MPVKPFSTVYATPSIASHQEEFLASPPSALPVATEDDSEGDSYADGDTTAIIRALLGVLTAKRFESVSHLIIVFVDKSEGEAHGERLRAATQAIVEAAVEDEMRAPLIARLCRKIMEQISDGVMDEGIKNSEGQPITGGLLFRKYLLNRCQEDFERGWCVQAQTTAAAKENAEDDAAKKGNEASQGLVSAEDLLSDEDYAAQKLFFDEYWATETAKRRRGPGLARFIGELFKLQMLTERLMHSCIMNMLLVSSVDNPGEEIESICKLLSTVGQALDLDTVGFNERLQMDVYFKLLRVLSNSPNIDSRMKFMLQDLIELRERKWAPRNATAAPTTVCAGRDQAAKAGDLSQSGEISKFGVGSVFAGMSGDQREHAASLSHSTRNNPFTVLMQNSSGKVTDAPSTSRSRGSRVGHSQSGLSKGRRGRKMPLVPHSNPLEDVSATPEKKTAAPMPDEHPPKRVLSEAQIKKQLEEDTKEFFGIKQLDKSEQYFESLPEDQRYRLVDAMSKSASGVVSLGPASVFAGKKGDKREHTASMSRSTSSNPFAALTQNPGENAADAPSTSRSRKPRVDFSQSGLSEGDGRRKLQLLPRSKPLEKFSATPEKTETPEESEDEPPKRVLSEAQIKKQIEEDTNEFFAVKKLDESEQYFESLPEDQRHRLVDAVFTRALDFKEAEATLSGNMFALALEKGKVTPDILEKGFSGPIEFLDDIAVDAPAAYALTAKIMHLSKFDEARVRRLAEKIAVDGDPLVAPKDKLLKEFSKLSS